MCPTGYLSGMDVPQLILIALVVALVVAAITWFGPRAKQWRTNDGRPTEQAGPLQPLSEEEDELIDPSADTDRLETDDDYRQEPPPEGPHG